MEFPSFVEPAFLITLTDEYNKQQILNKCNKMGSKVTDNVIICVLKNQRIEKYQQVTFSMFSEQIKLKEKNQFCHH
jgi:hypothetical protein